MSDKAALVVFFPVNPHVYKYLQNKCGEKLTVTKNNFFGSMVLDVLSKDYADLKVVTNDIVYPVEISERYMEKMGIFINPQIIRKFNTRVDDVFREEMRTYTYASFRFNKVPKEKALKQFLLFYNINEEDIKFETLVRDMKRNPPSS
jgi:hypothetical protein